MDTRSCVQEMTRMMTALDVILALDRFYHKDIEVSAIGQEERIRTGKAAGSSGVHNWFTNCTLHAVHVEFQAIDGDNAAVELLVDSTPNGQDRRLERLVMLQIWKDGKIIRMTNYSKRVTG